MKLGRVVGNVVSTINHEFFDGERLLMVRLVDNNADTGSYLICTDRQLRAPVDTKHELADGNHAEETY